MRTPQRRALLPLSLVAALALSSCGAPNSGPTPEAEQSQAAPAEKTATTRHAEGSHVPTGHVSAHLPSRDPDVLVDRKMVEHSPARDARILTLDRAGALSRTVWALGMGENLIGRDTASDFPGVKDLPLVTPGGHSINAETVLSLRPGIVLTDGSIGPSRVMKKLRATGVKVIDITAERTPETIGTLIEEVAAGIGLEQAAEQVTDQINEKLDGATASAKSRADGRGMMILYVRGTGVAMIAGPESGGRSVIQRLGGTDAGEKLGINGSFTPLTPEALIEAAPDTLIIMSSGLESVGGVDGLLEVPGVSQTPAGKNRSVLDVPDSELLSFGPNTPVVIDAMAEALYGD